MQLWWPRGSSTGRGLQCVSCTWLQDALYYAVTNDFYVVDIGDTNAIMGVQWLYSLGECCEKF